MLNTKGTRREARCGRSQLAIARAGLFFSFAAVCSVFAVVPCTASEGLEAYQEKAKAFGSYLELPEFEQSPEEVKAAIEAALQKAEAAFDLYASQDLDTLTFESAIVALENIGSEVSDVSARINILRNASQDAQLRNAATESLKRVREWAVEMDYREDLYRVVKAYADTKPQLEGEDALLLEKRLQSIRRIGLHLPPAQRESLEAMRKELSSMESDFRSNISSTQQELFFSAAELEGVPESLLGQNGVKVEEDKYRLLANVTFHFVSVMENCQVEETRKVMKQTRYRLAAEQNVPLLQRIVKLRSAIASALGYATWADYAIEPKMAGDARTALDFELALIEGLEPKFQAELEVYRKLKVAETGDPGATINIWDWRYYRNQLSKSKYQVDTEALRVFFPYEQTLQGMFSVYERCFGLTISPIDPPFRWVDDLSLHLVSDAESGEPLGLVYLDMFPREGKYNHFAQFAIQRGRLMPDGRYRRPTVALLCNFPKPLEGKPALLSHDEMETLFHEFGHALHSILTRAKYQRFSGTAVPRDFVEVPSQLLERWIWDKEVLDTFAADYRDPENKIPASALERMKEARLATIGTHYRRQLGLGLLDLRLHTEVASDSGLDVVALSNQVLSETFLQVPEDTSFVAFFGHLMNYDAGYYGYAWADAIASDLATVFEESEDRFFDTEASMRLRKEIYEPGGSRPIEESIRAFLGRERSLRPFLEEVGISSEDG